MDIKLDRSSTSSENDFSAYANEKLGRYFSHYPFVQSVQLYLRAKKHATKKVKINVRLKGKAIFAEAKGLRHHDALENALQKLEIQLQKYKGKRYKAA